tara:strand:+ start:397 stop:567 length:171 start_codon:yes stop_codon:yes gene_type:complete
MTDEWWEQILEVYINIVGEAEGVDFLGAYTPGILEIGLDAEQTAKLYEIAMRGRNA